MTAQLLFQYHFTGQTNSNLLREKHLELRSTLFFSYFSSIIRQRRPRIKKERKFLPARREPEKNNVRLHAKCKQFLSLHPYRFDINASKFSSLQNAHGEGNFSSSKENSFFFSVTFHRFLAVSKFELSI